MGIHTFNVFKFGYTGWRHPIKNTIQFFKNCRYAFQRATKGYCDYDTWDLDWYLSDLIVRSLNEFSEKTDGYPGDNSSYEEWVAKIKNISSKINAYDEYEKKYDCSFDYSDKRFEEMEEAIKTRAEGFKELGDIIEKLWW